MNLQASLRNLLAALVGLGTRRLMILGTAGLVTFAAVGLAGVLLSRPSFELLYAGLDRQDVTRIGAALRDADVSFDVSADGASVLVPWGQTSRARMLLAEKGLPHSSSVGYELFDKMGSLGLTSFMQDVTRVRALEGELARTIQTMHGVRAARVHLVLADEGSFRRARQAPSASVVLRTDVRADAAMARAIRHLVASSIAGMGVEAVTVLTTDGETLAAGNETDLAASGTMLGLERALSDTLGDNIRRTLAPYLGAQNMQVSVAARLNTDRRQTNETIFNPDSRVERSVRTIKEMQAAQNAGSPGATSVDRNLPASKGASAESRQSTEENQKREEITNYEVSSKQVATVSGGYAIDRLDVAVLVNSAGLGAELAPDAAEKRLSDIRELAMAAAGLRKDRGDTIKVSAVAFKGLETDAAPSLLGMAGPILLRQTGTLVNAIAAVAIVGLLLLFGAKPLLRLARAPDALPQALAAGAAVPDAVVTPSLEAAPPPLELAHETPRRAIQRRLEQIVTRDEVEAASLLKRWIRSGAPT